METGDAPPAVRNFIRKSSELTQNIVWISFFQLFFVVLAGLDALTPAALARDVWLGLAAIGLVIGPFPIVGMFAQMRKLLKAGYTREDLESVWKQTIAADEPDRVLEHARTPGLVERASRVAVTLGWASIIASAAVAGFFAGRPRASLPMGQSTP